MRWRLLGNLRVIDSLPPTAGSWVTYESCTETSFKKSAAVTEKFKMIEMIATRMVMINFCKAHDVS
jgi:hypothetical protein